jgi:hypothetical protein
MPILIRDEDAVKELAAAKGLQELRSPDGRFLGQFIPAESSADYFPEFGITYSELRRQINDPSTKRCTPEQVMARLREIDRCST